MRLRGRQRHLLPHRRGSDTSDLTKLSVTTAAALVIGVVAGTATWSTWTTQTDNSGNTFSAAIVQLSDNDTGSAMFALAGLEPGFAESRCIRVDYTGSRPAAVRQYAATTAGTGLEAYLNLTVTRGSVSSGGFADCTNFTPDAADHVGLGSGVLFNGLMSTYPTSWATGIADPQGSWNNADSHYYRFTVTMVADNDAQGRSSTQTYSWEAR